ncbi:MAG: hypothetical protein JNN30_20395 [Rhodanobacteraceae bacterium]|nr:hypothetical protein [Rhodanobacteraceae bacterium]
MHTLQRSSERLGRLGILLAAGLAPLSAAPAADWRYVEPLTEQDYGPVHFVTGSNESIWSFDRATIRHTQATGSSTIRYRKSLGIDPYPAFFDKGVATADGGLIAYDNKCRLQRIEADGRATWHVDLKLTPCKGVSILRDGTTWIAGADERSITLLYQIGAQGQVLTRRWPGADAAPPLALAHNLLVDFVALPNGGDIELTQGNAVPADADVIRRDESGNVLWRRHLPGIERVYARRIVADASGGADVIGMSGNSLSIIRIGANGQLLFSREISLSGTGDLVTAHRGSDGSLYLVTLLDEHKLIRIDAGGRLAWEKRYCPAGSTPPTPELLLAVSGDTVANLCARSDADLLVQRRADGSEREQTLPFDDALQLSAGGNGEWLVLGRENAQRPYRTRLIGIGNGTSLREFPLGSPNERDVLTLLAAAVGDDDSSYLLTQGEYEHSGGALTPSTGRPVSPPTLTRLGSDGMPLWRKTLPGTHLISEAKISAKHGLVCVNSVAVSQDYSIGSKRLSAFCLHSSDGRAFGAAYSAPGQLGASGPGLRESPPIITPNPAPDRATMEPIRGGRAVLVTSAQSGHRVQINDGTNTTPLLSGSSRLYNLGIDDDGHVTLAFENSIERYDIRGVRQYHLASSPIGIYGAPFVTDAEGRVYANGSLRGSSNSRNTTLMAISSGGSIAWQSQSELHDARTLVVQGGAIYITQSDRGVGAVPQRYSTSKFSAQDGRVLWSHPTTESVYARFRGLQLSLLANGSEVAVLGNLGNRLLLKRLDAGSGRLTAERVIDCNGQCSRPAMFAISSSGEGRTAYTVLDHGAGQTAVAQSLGDVQREPAATRIDQPGITGLWHAPYTTGQGLSIDWLADSRTLFAAWFTYTSSGSNEARELRWFTLQANNVAPGTTELDLPVLQTVGGNFAAGPGVSPSPVGYARLRFLDCERASLSYGIGNADVGFASTTGTITLSRVTPATQPCVLADGSTRPGSGARPAAQGFDARQSGAWYDETALGQGLQLNIQPDGVFFATWFTYDPQNHADEATQQHWFTLQGNLAEASNGRVEAKLIRTTGGTFDGLPTSNATIAGTATLRMQGCDRATLEYRFDPGSNAGLHAGLRGTLNLKRMGGCAP